MDTIAQRSDCTSILREKEEISVLSSHGYELYQYVSMCLLLLQRISSYPGFVNLCYAVSVRRSLQSERTDTNKYDVKVQIGCYISATPM